ncbi:MAG: V-type ATP synthase subunit I [Candidatus Thermoplasmatota archaeon]|nr:V-type ATP synthase subunit I [Candidatus Thermoplasmatota archaeon]MBU1941797.1 V-type ATP synthase subunit I [Candidatus Thermoplasmatota archaeon]
MKKVSIIVHQQQVEDVIETLHETGVAEIIDISKDDPELLKETERATTHPEASNCSEYELRLTRLIDILKRTQKKPSGIKALLHPALPEKTYVDPNSLDELYSNAESILQDIEQTCIEYDEEQHALQQKIDDLEEELHHLQVVQSFDFNLKDLGTSQYLYIVAGTTHDLSAVTQNLKVISDEIELFSHAFGTKKERKWAVVIASHISFKEAVDKLCRDYIETFTFAHYDGTPRSVFSVVQKHISEFQDKKQELVHGLSTYALSHLQELLVLREEIRLERFRKEISKNFAKTMSTYVIKAWVLAEDEQNVKQQLIQKTNDSIIYESKKPSANPDNPPTYMKLPKWAASFQTLLELFAIPKYNELNPTIPMGIFFIIFFGVMLGDGGYGLVIFILSLFGFFYIGKSSSMIRTFSFLGIWLGLTTTIVGFLTNSFFGDFIPQFIYHDPDRLIFSLTIFGIHLPVESLKDPLLLLTIALVFGLLHMNLGIVLAIIQTTRNKQYKELVTNHFSWILLEIGGGLLIAENLLKMMTLTTLVQYIAAIFVVIGLILRLLHSGPLGFFDITGFVGDWLSYARLLALGLATTGMALAFNIVAMLFATMIPLEIVALIVMSILLVGLHLINLLLQALGAGVHSLRLQYVEFFNRFYSGGGHKFKPFSIKRTYTTTKRGKIS